MVNMSPIFPRWLYNNSTYGPAKTDQNAGISRVVLEPNEPARAMLKHRTYVTDTTFTIARVVDGEYNPVDPNSESNLEI